MISIKVFVTKIQSNQQGPSLSEDIDSILAFFAVLFTPVLSDCIHPVLEQYSPCFRRVFTLFQNSIHPVLEQYSPCFKESIQPGLRKVFTPVLSDCIHPVLEQYSPCFHYSICLFFWTVFTALCQTDSTHPNTRRTLFTPVLEGYFSPL